MVAVVILGDRRRQFEDDNISFYIIKKSSAAGIKIKIFISP
jgi:hypothetical protein